MPFNAEVAQDAIVKIVNKLNRTSKLILMRDQQEMHNGNMIELTSQQKAHIESTIVNLVTDAKTICTNLLDHVDG